MATITPTISGDYITSFTCDVPCISFDVAMAGTNYPQICHEAALFSPFGIYVTLPLIYGPVLRITALNRETGEIILFQGDTYTGWPDGPDYLH